MPGRNIEKIYIPDNFYHVYNRGLGKMDIFCDPEDYAVFLNLLKRTLGSEVVRHPKKGYDYPNYYKEISLNAYCLMTNHFHLLIKTHKKPKLLPELMKSVLTAYVMYFNKKYKRTGPLFGTRYRAVRITDDTQLQHITRYIHLNPLDKGSDYFSYKYSSLQYYLDSRIADWVEPKDIMNLFDEKPSKYLDFLKEYEGHREYLKKIKNDLY